MGSKADSAGKRLIGRGRLRRSFDEGISVSTLPARADVLHRRSSHVSVPCCESTPGAARSKISVPAPRCGLPSCRRHRAAVRADPINCARAAFGRSTLRGYVTALESYRRAPASADDASFWALGKAGASPSSELFRCGMTVLSPDRRLELAGGDEQSASRWKRAQRRRRWKLLDAER